MQDATSVAPPAGGSPDPPGSVSESEARMMTAMVLYALERDLGRYVGSLSDAGHQLKTPVLDTIREREQSRGLGVGPQ